MLDGLRSEYSIAELCRRAGIAESLYYAWSKEFLEAGSFDIMDRVYIDFARRDRFNLANAFFVFRQRANT